MDNRDPAANGQKRKHASAQLRLDGIEYQPGTIFPLFISRVQSRPGSFGEQGVKQGHFLEGQSTPEISLDQDCCCRGMGGFSRGSSQFLHP